jgi:hypothetical protein
MVRNKKLELGSGQDAELKAGLEVNMQRKSQRPREDRLDSTFL